MGIKKLLTDNSFYVAIIITLLLLYSSLVTINTGDIKFSFNDKIAHFTAYFVLTFLWLLSLRETPRVLVCLGCFIFGLLVEYLQYTFTYSRKAELYDVVANSIGILLSWYSYTLVKKKFT